MSFDPYTDRAFLGDQALAIVDMLKQIAALLQTLVDQGNGKKDKTNG